MDQTNTSNNAYVFRPKLLLGELVWPFIIASILIFILYPFPVDIGLNSYTFFILGICTLTLVNIVKYVLQPLSLITINQDGLSYTGAIKYFSWRVQWNELNMAVSRSDGPSSPVLFLPKKKLRLKVRSLPSVWGKWHRIDVDNEEKKLTPKQAINEFIPVDNIDDVRVSERGQLPLRLRLSETMNEIPFFLCILPFLYLAYSWFSGVYPYSIIGTGLVWLSVFSVIGAILLAKLYMLKTDKKLVETYLHDVCCSLIILAVAIFFLLKSAVIFFGENRSLEFTLEVKDGGYQSWRSQEEPGLFFSSGRKADEVKTRLVQGETKIFKIKSAFNVHLIYPD